MAFRHLPFGVPEQSLQKEMHHRRLKHRRLLTARLRKLARLRTAAAELDKYQAMLAAELVVLEDEERMLLRDLAELGAPDGPPPRAPDEAAALASLHQDLQYYRSLQTHLNASVLALIAPFLAADAPRENRKEETAWPSSLPPNGSGSGAR